MRDAAEQASPNAAVLIFKIELPVVGKRHASNSQLLFRLAASGFQQRLISLNDTPSGGVQHPRLVVFRFGAALHQDFAHAVVHDDIGCPVTQALRTHLFTARLRDDLIVFADNIDPFRACQMILLDHPKTLP